MDSKYNLNSGQKKLIKKLKLKHKLNGFKNNGGPPQKKQKLLKEQQIKKQFSDKINSVQEHKTLPIFDAKKRFLEEFKKHNTMILIGETGSGKTTQIPQFIYSTKYLNNNGKLGITQPRRVAAISIAKRVAHEMNCELGKLVGYTVRFEDMSSDSTKIKFLTDGMLLRESLTDKLLTKYSVIILDEAHERTIHTDVLFGIVKNVQNLRKDQNLAPLKIIIMSATMDAKNFSKYFNCPIFYAIGRPFNIDIYHAVKEQEDYEFACMVTLFQIHKAAPANEDVLIFLTGQEQIESIAYSIRKIIKDELSTNFDNNIPLKIFPLYAGLPNQQQLDVLQKTPRGTRKVILSTNIAETSLTISGIKYVIDTGMVKARTYHPGTGFDILKIQKISQAQALQRTGRAGRESNGKCYRLYTRQQYDTFLPMPIPEIQRCNLVNVILQLLTLEIDIWNFDFMDKPSMETIQSAVDQLLQLKAIKLNKRFRNNKKKKKNFDNNNNTDTSSISSESSETNDISSLLRPPLPPPYVLTASGEKMIKFPLLPNYSKIILKSRLYGCIDEIVSIVALLSSENIFYTPTGKKDEAIGCRKRFISPHGDLITLLNVFRECLNSSDIKNWCKDYYLNYRNIDNAMKIRQQLLEILERLNIEITPKCTDMDQIRKCLLHGLFMNVAELHGNKKYVTLDSKQTVQIHPSSVLHGTYPQYVLFTELVLTGKCFMRTLCVIDPEWLYEIVPNYMKIHKLTTNGFSNHK